MPEEQKNALLAQAIAELSGSNPPAELAALIETKAAEIASVRLAAEQRTAHIADFAASCVGGKTNGLPVQKDELVTFLSSLTDEQREAAEKLLSQIVDAGLIDFSEHGHNKVLQGTAVLSAPNAASLRKWLDAGSSIEEFFKINSVELGAMSDYNLSEFVSKEK